MAIIGFNFTKIEAEKSGNVSGKVNINNNVMITDAKAIEISIADKDSKGILVGFKYSCLYEPGVGKVNLEGNVVLMEKAEIVKASIDSWQKNKSIDKDLTRVVLSQVLHKSTIEAIIMSRELGLPAPVPLPKIGPKPDAAKAAAPKVEQKKK